MLTRPRFGLGSLLLLVTLLAASTAVLLEMREAQRFDLLIEQHRLTLPNVSGENFRLDVERLVATSDVVVDRLTVETRGRTSVRIGDSGPSRNRGGVGVGTIENLALPHRVHITLVTHRRADDQVSIVVDAEAYGSSFGSSFHRRCKANESTDDALGATIKKGLYNRAEPVSIYDCKGQPLVLVVE